MLDYCLILRYCEKWLNERKVAEYGLDMNATDRMSRHFYEK